MYNYVDMFVINVNAETPTYKNRKRAFLLIKSY